MLDYECKVGLKVVCRHQAFYGYYGTISAVKRDANGFLITYQVIDFFGNSISSAWTQPASWDIATDQTELVIKRPSLSKECPCGIHRSRCDYHK